MNIKPKYYDGIMLAQGKYELRVDALGYKAQDRIIHLTMDRTIQFNLTNLKTKIATKKKSTKSKNGSTIVLRNESEGILHPRSSAVVSNSQRNSPGVMKPKSFFKDDFGRSAVLTKDSQNVFKQNRRDRNHIDTLSPGDWVVILYRESFRTVYVMYKNSRGQYAYGWLVNFASASAISLTDYGSIHPAYFKAVLDGYYEKLTPLPFYSKGTSDHFEKGKKVDVLMAKSDWRNVLVMTPLRYGGSKGRWISRNHFYTSFSEAKQALYQPIVTVFYLIMAVCVFYWFFALFFKSGRDLLAALGEHVLTIGIGFFYAFLFCASGAIFVTGTIDLLTMFSSVDRDILVNIPKYFIVFGIPFLVLLPLYLYVVKMFYDTNAIVSEVNVNSAVTLSRTRANHQNKSIEKALGSADMSIDGLLVKEEAKRMKLAKEALDKRTAAYSALVDSAKKQREAIVRTEHEKETD